MDLSTLTPEQRAAFDAAVVIWKTPNPAGDFSPLRAWKFTEWDNVSVEVADEFVTAAALGTDDTTVIDIVCKIEELVAASANRSESEIVTALEAVQDWRPEFKERALAHARAVGWIVATTSSPPPPLPSVFTVTGISPAEGEETGGTEVTIVGSGFETGSEVSFVDASGMVVIATDVVVASATKITAKMPPHAPDIVAVAVRLTTGETAAMNDAFTFKAKVVAPPPPPSRTAPPLSLPPAGSTSPASLPMTSTPVVASSPIPTDNRTVIAEAMRVVGTHTVTELRRLVVPDVATSSPVALASGVGVAAWILCACGILCVLFLGAILVMFFVV